MKNVTEQQKQGIMKRIGNAKIAFDLAESMAG